MNGREKSGINTKMREMLQYAYEKAPAVRKRFEKFGVTPTQINFFEDLVKLPPLTKEELMESEKIYPSLGGFLTIPIQNLEWIFVSPGPVYEPPQDITILAKMFSIHGFRKGDIVLNTFSYHLVPAGLLFDSALRNLGITVIPGGVGNTEIQVQIMRELGVTGYVGTSSFLMTLIEQTNKLGYQIKKDFRLRCASVTGEMLAPSLRNKLENEYGIRVSQYYGTAEIGTIAYECEECEGMHINDEGVVVEIIDPETGRQLVPGEIGEVVVTSLSKIFPLIRFRTGDLSSSIEEKCRCERDSYRLKGILGRIGQAVKVRGMFLHPKQLEEAASRISQIGRIQAIITRSGTRDELRLRVELKESQSDEAIEETLRQDLKSNVQALGKLKVDDIEFVSVDSISESEPIILDKRIWQ